MTGLIPAIDVPSQMEGSTYGAIVSAPVQREGGRSLPQVTIQCKSLENRISSLDVWLELLQTKNWTGVRGESPMTSL